MASQPRVFRTAIRLLWQTRPFIPARLAVYGVFLFATIGYMTTFLLLLDLTRDSVLGQIVVLVFALALFLTARRYLARTLSYVGHGPHIMAMVQARRGKKLPRGSAQVDLSTRHLEKVYPEQGRLIKVESLLSRLMRETRGIILPPGSEPILGLSRPGKVGDLMYGWSAKSIKDAILGYTLDVGKPNHWESARRGVVVYAQQAPEMARSAFRIWLFGIGFALVFVLWFVIQGWPLLGQAASMGISTLIFVCAGIVKLAWVIKAGVFEPFAMAYLLTAFIGRAEELEIDESWYEKLEDRSKRFRDISERARTFKPVDSSEYEDEAGDDFVDEPKPPKRERKRRRRRKKEASDDGAQAELTETSSGDASEGASSEPTPEDDEPSSTDESSESAGVAEPNEGAEPDEDDSQPSVEL